MVRVDEHEVEWREPRSVLADELCGRRAVELDVRDVLNGGGVNPDPPLAADPADRLVLVSAEFKVTPRPDPFNKQGNQRLMKCLVSFHVAAHQILVSRCSPS